MPVKLLLVRHGQSTWNLENLFTGWTDVDLSAQGIEEARRAGDEIARAGLAPDCVLTSVLKHVQDVKPVNFDTALDLRDSNTITLAPEAFGVVANRRQVTEHVGIAVPPGVVGTHVEGALVTLQR